MSESEPSGPEPKELNPKRIALPETPDEQALDEADADDEEEDEKEAQPKRQNAEFHLSTPTFHVVVSARSLRSCERAVNRTRDYFEKRESQRFRTATRSVR